MIILMLIMCIVLLRLQVVFVAASREVIPIYPFFEFWLLLYMLFVFLVNVVMSYKLLN